MSDSFKVQIKGHEWKISFLTEKAYIKKHGADSGAITVVKEAITMAGNKSIDFQKDFCTMGIIRHELLHAFVEESNTDSSNLNPDQREELCATIQQKEFFTIEMLVTEIVNQRMSKKE